MSNWSTRRGVHGARIVIAFLPLLLAATGCVEQRPQEDPAAARAAIVGANRQFVEAFHQRDAAAIARLYDEGAELMPPGSDALRGGEAIELFWRSVLDLQVEDIVIETVDVFADGDIASEVGRYTYRGTDGAVYETGKYVVIWRRGPDGWRLHREIWNSNAPPLRPAPAPEETPGG